MSSRRRQEADSNLAAFRPPPDVGGYFRWIKQRYSPEVLFPFVIEME